MNNFKRLLSGIITTVLVLIVLPTSAFSADPEPLITITTFSTDKTTFDPADSAEDQNVQLSYTLSSPADTVKILIYNNHDKEIKNFTADSTQLTTGNFIWDGEYSSRIVPQASYYAKLIVTKTAQATVTSSPLSFNVSYNHSKRPSIRNFEVSPETFDNDYDDALFTFTNDEDADITFEIVESDYDFVKSFSDYTNDDYDSDDDISIAWDGTSSSGYKKNDGTYKGIVTVRNSYGCFEYEKSVKIDDDSSSYSSSTSHIKNISFKPSTTFEPAEDDDLEIEFDIRKDLDELAVYAQRGSEKIELYQEDDVDKDNDFDEVTWDGTDEDDEYADAGTWQILIESKVDGRTYTASKAIKLKYDKPTIDELYLSKTEFDNELDESTYVIFKLEDDANVDIFLYLDDDKEDELVEDMDVEKDKWYAVEWDGDDYDYGDDLDFKLIAKNITNEDIYDSEKISIKLREDDVSSSKSNVTEDQLSPVIGEDTDSFELSYNLEDDADVKIAIYKGKTSSGTKMIELLDVDDQDNGDHTIQWNGRDDDGRWLKDGLYTYKITSKYSSTDTEYGHFAIGKIGDIDGDGSLYSSRDDDDDDDRNSDNDKIASGVIIDGGTGSSHYNNNDNSNDDSLYCAGFSDILISDSKCDAIKWAKDSGIFNGYDDGTFRSYAVINRAELLKVILEAFDVAIMDAGNSTLGFVDVQGGAWYMKYIKTAQLINVFNGDQFGHTARPSDFVNRAETLKIMLETLQTTKGVPLVTCEIPYKDVKLTDWFAKYTCTSRIYGLITDDYLNPTAYATRGEVAVMLYKISQFGNL